MTRRRRVNKSLQKIDVGKHGKLRHENQIYIYMLHKRIRFDYLQISLKSFKKITGLGRLSMLIAHPAGCQAVFCFRLMPEPACFGAGIFSWIGS